MSAQTEYDTMDRLNALESVCSKLQHRNDELQKACTQLQDECDRLGKSSKISTELIHLLKERLDEHDSKFEVISEILGDME